ncbi:putative Ig domain-containing protein [Microvirga sesbaniae]|uniref:putative Ig domain-containing protein n=1 Tax=Microvirga sesbaniae TaxID=681392 RepID=UPI00358DBECC
MKEFTDTHDLIHLFARNKDALPPVGLSRPPKGYSNSDGDPRGAWKAEHKGAKARRANSDFDTYQPPYRWELVDGHLPPGLWRISPFTGVIWGSPTEAGTFKFKVEVRDRKGKSTTRELQIDVAPDVAEPARPSIPWLFEQIDTKGELRISTETLPPARLGAEYSAILLADGGTPYTGDPIRPTSGRYWEFAKATLIDAYQRDSVYLGSRQPTAIPHPKQYAPAEGVLEIENQQTVWPGRVGDGSKRTTLAGYTEDATKHLKAMKALGLIKTEVSTAKPEPLLRRLVEIFTRPGDVVLEALSSSADLAAVALKQGRAFVALQGASRRDRELAEACAIPRLRAVVEGEDRDLENRTSEIRLSPDSYIPFEGGGAFAVSEVGGTFIELPKNEDLATIADLSDNDDLTLCKRVLGTAGFIPSELGTEGQSIEGKRRAIVIPPSEFLTPEIAAEIASSAQMSKAHDRISVYYFRSSEDLEVVNYSDVVRFYRVPFEMLQEGTKP